MPTKSKSRHSSRAIQRLTFLFVIFLAPQLQAQSIAEATTLYNQGKYDEAAAHAAKALTDGQTIEDWYELKIRSELVRGKYADALKTLDEGLMKRPKSVRLRWLGHRVCRFNGDDQRAKTLLDDIIEFVKKQRWLYTDAQNYVTLGRYYLDAGADPKDVLKSFYDRARLLKPKYAEASIAAGDLGLAKHDYGLAAVEYEKAAEVDTKNPDVFFGIAMAYAPSDGKKSKAALQAAIEKNENHVDSLLYLVDEHIDSEHYDAANKVLEQVLKVNDKHPRLWAYRAVLAHLNNDAEVEKECRDRALAHWKTNPDVDHLIGNKLSQKYRFEEGAVYQRLALKFDADYLPAKMQLSQDLLRLGDEEEGWKLADEVYEKDGYNVVAHNLVTLRDHITKYTILESDGFVVRMETREAKIYGQPVLKLLARAKEELCAKYEVELEEPIYVEIFPEQQDFAIRTFGLPGGAGFLGVCFGRVITMNSPASQGNSPSNWQAVLWHEFCHVVTLFKTKNKMPRWLSEGISVYEERQANSSWGQTMNPQYREMVLGDDLTPVSQLSGAFLNPKSGLHLQFAYYESSLVVEYLVEKYGLDTLKRILVDLGVGMPINDSLARYTGSLEALDKEFAEYARKRARDLAPNLDFAKPAPDVELAPNNFYLLQRQAAQFISDEKYEEAKQPLGEIIKYYEGAQTAYSMLAKAHRELGETEEELVVLNKLAALSNDSVDAYTRLMEINVDEQNWNEVLVNAERSLAVNPLSRTPHRFMAKATEQTGAVDRAIEALQTLIVLEPIDPADTHFRLAKLLRTNGDFASARRHILTSLEEAPRFRAAHRELLAILAEIELPQPGEQTNSPQSGVDKTSPQRGPNISAQGKAQRRPGSPNEQIRKP